MDCSFTQLTYADTHSFSPIVTAYVAGDERLSAFRKHPVSREGIEAAIAARSSFPTDREALVAELLRQYEGVDTSDAVSSNIDALRSTDTFTICTAHQPAIFTGTLFFVYKILHVVKLAQELGERMPAKRFVPVFYMGSEDADIGELGHIFLGGEKIAWQTKQKGAVGRMVTSGLDPIIERISGELSVLPHGEKLISLLRECYRAGTNIQTATLKLVNELFGEHGVVVLIPDSPAFKKQLIPVFEDELFARHASGLVEKTGERLGRDFKIQAHPREINLFYLGNGLRERIVHEGDEFAVINTGLRFSAEQIRQELRDHPERFSPNVILRGILQETILPNIAFVGGGGELAYWLELKSVFEHYGVPYPVLILRNSFLVIDNKQKALMEKLRLSVNDIFISGDELVTRLVRARSENQLSLSDEQSELAAFYARLKNVAAATDLSLQGHVGALESAALKRVQALEKKLLRAEKRKFDAERRQVAALKQALFPNGGLQERVDNFMPYFARWGSEFFETILRHSLTLEQRFGVIMIK